MKRTLLALLILPVSVAVPAANLQCEGAVLARMASGPTVLAPVASGLSAVNPQLGSQRGVLAPAFDEMQSVDNVLLRLRTEGCRAAALPVPAAAVPAAAAGYVKKTEFDNTPYRFNMTQNGKRMTADDFDAWLKANGYSAGRRAEAPKPVAVPEAAPTTEE